MGVRICEREIISMLSVLSNFGVLVRGENVERCSDIQMSCIDNFFNRYSWI